MTVRTTAGLCALAAILAAPAVQAGQGEAAAAGVAVAQAGQVLTPPGGGEDFADGPGTRGRLAPGGQVMSVIDRPADADWFAVDLQRDTVYAFDMQGAPTGAGTLPDPLLTLHDARGGEVARDDDGGEDFNARLVFPAPQTGRYFIAARAFGDATGTYILSAADRGPARDDFAADDGTAGRLSVGGTAGGELELPNDVDWFAIELDAGVGYAIGMEGQPTGRGTLPDPLLTLHDASGAEVARDDDGGQGLNARISHVPRRAGTHYVAAQAFGGNTGTYVLTADTAPVQGPGKPGPGGPGPAVGDDYADGPDTTGRLPLGDTVQGRIDTPGDADWFAVELTAGVAHLFDMRGAPDGTLQDGLLTLHDADGNEVARDDDGGEGLNPRLAYVPPNGGRYYVAARGFGDNTGTYTLTGLARPDLRDDHPASAETTARVAIGRPGHGEIELPGDADWFAVELDPGNTYSFDLEGQPTAQGTLADPLLALHDSRGNEIARDDDGATGLNARVTYRPERAGIYYLAAQAFGSSTGTYTLTVDRYAGFEDDFAGGPETEGRLAIGDGATGTLEVPQDEDWFAVSLDRGTTYTIGLEGQPTGAGSLPDPLLSVHDAEGRELARDDDGGDSFNARLTFSPPASDVYFVNAQGFGGASGSYRVTIQEGGVPGPVGK